MKVKVLFISCILAAVAWAESNAAVISMNPITGTPVVAVSPYTLGETHDTNITTTGIGYSPALTAVDVNNRYNVKGWSTSLTLDPNTYFTFTLDANPGYKINFTKLVYTSTAGSGGNAPTLFAIRSSVDGFTSNIGSPTATGATIDLSGAQFQNLTDPIEFRLYGYGAAATSGRYSINDYSFNGSVDAVPEPGSLALLGAGSILMGGYLKRMRKETKVVA